MNVRIICIVLGFIVIISTLSGIQAKEYPGRAREQSSSLMEKEWEVLVQNQEQEWLLLKKEVEEKWERFVHSTKKTWIDYHRDRCVRSRVDFEKGRIILEAVVPDGEPEGLQKAREEIRKQAVKIFSRENVIKEAILEKQVIDKKGKVVGPGNVERYLREEVLPAVKAASLSFLSRDGKKRRMYDAQIDFVPDHIRIRAEKYLPIVKRNAERFRIKPPLILAIIHTESCFNPMAISPCHAFGIMQIIPRHAGREAYRFIYDKDDFLTPEYLYNPENNIELGSAYLHLLRYHHFNDIKGNTKNRYITICGYNWGPTSVRKKVLDNMPVNEMVEDDVLRLLIQKLPKETRDYLKAILGRMPLYQDIS